HADGTSASNTDYGVTTTTGDVKLEAVNHATIEAEATAASVAAGAGFAAGGVAGAGASATNVILGRTNAYIDDSLTNSGRDGVAAAGAKTGNRIQTNIKAYIDGDRATGTTGIHANNIALKANDDSTITATTQSASLAKSFGVIGASVSIGVGLARNEISNQVE